LIAIHYFLPSFGAEVPIEAGAGFELVKTVFVVVCLLFLAVLSETPAMGFSFKVVS